ncbi:MAG: leucyl aminopeptidase [Acidobacteria bacterium]|nr:leucyl aminopeptidase [Acidobacteriota bacterium]
MDVILVNTGLAQVEADALAVIAFERTEGATAVSGESAAAVDAICGGWISETLASGEFSGKLLEQAVLARPTGLKAKKLIAVGGGKAEKFTATEMRKAAAAVLRAWKPKKCAKIALAFDVAFQNEEMAAAATEGALLGDYEPDTYKTDPKKNDSKVESFALVSSEGDAAVAGVTRGRILAEAQNFTRTLVNEPGNRLTPTILAERARTMAQEFGLGCDILSADRMKQLGMGSLLGVAMGSAEPPVTIVLTYTPAEGSATTHLGLIGKGVTFDTGGISIKPSDGMEKMKYDMAGGAAAIGAMRAIAQLKPKVPVTAVIPSVENMPGSRAMRPGDIVTTLNGKTVEVLNTDAEGRLILCDALEYAQRLGCTHMVDAATLTGAIVVALGYVNIGCFSNNDEFRDQVLSAAKTEGEKMWPMPLDEEYKDLLKSPIADLANIGGRWGGAISAAKFLEEFSGGKPWVHLDIAGTAWLEEGKPFLSKGPSGVCVRTFVRLAMGL